MKEGTKAFGFGKKAQQQAPAEAPAESKPADPNGPPADDQPPFPEAEARAQAEAARKGETKTREQREADFKAKHKGGTREPGSEG